MPIDDPVRRGIIQGHLDQLEERLEKNPEDFQPIWDLPPEHFTYASRERLVAGVDFYNQLKDSVNLICFVVNGSAAHGYAKPTHDVDIFPFFDDRGYKERDYESLNDTMNALTEKMTRKYNFEISPKPIASSLMERIILATADNPPYFVLGKREEFYKFYNRRD
jgi:hypothetical protein